MITMLRHSDPSIAKYPALTIYRLPARISAQQLAPFPELVKVFGVTSETVHSDDGNFIQFRKEQPDGTIPEGATAMILPGQISLKTIWFVSQWIRTGKPIWHMLMDDDGYQIIHAPGFPGEPGIPNRDWEHYMAFVLQTIGKRWAQFVALLP